MDYIQLWPNKEHLNFRVNTKNKIANTLHKHFKKKLILDSSFKNNWKYMIMEINFLCTIWWIYTSKLRGLGKDIHWHHVAIAFTFTKKIFIDCIIYDFSSVLDHKDATENKTDMVSSKFLMGFTICQG